MPSRLHVAIFFLLLFAVPGLLPAQDPNYVLIDKSKGLPSNAVYDIYQDSKGFIWIATEDGICRYDGFQFQPFYNDKQTSRAGSEIMEDCCGRIWYENFDGYLYYVEKDSLHCFTQEKTIGFTVYGITPKTLFLISGDGVELYDIHTLKKRKTVFIDMQKFGFSIGSGNYFYVNNDSLVRIDDNGTAVKFPFAPGSPESTRGKLINAGNGEVWAYGKTAGTCYKLQNQQVRLFFTMQETRFLHTASYTGGQVWFCSTSGAIAYNENGIPFENEHVFYPGKSISGVMRDRENNYWFSTTNEGILFVSDIRSRTWFSSYSPTQLMIHDSTLYFGTLNNTIEKIALPSMQLQNTIHAGNSHTVSMLSYGDAFAPVIMTSDSFRILDGERIVFRDDIAIKDIQRTGPGTYAFAATGLCGMFFTEHSPDNPWKHITWQFTNMAKTAFAGQSVGMLGGVRGKSVCADTLRQIVFFATNTGLFKATAAGVSEIKDRGQSLYLSSIAFFSGKIYAVSTQGELLSIDDQEQIISLTGEWRLPAHAIKGIRSDSNFLFFYSANTIYFITRNASSGIAGYFPVYTSDIYDIAAWDGMLFAATQSGILSIDLHRQTRQKAMPLLVFGKILVNGGTTSFSPAGNFVLGHDQNNLTIDYSVLSFRTGSAYPVYYRINQGNWELAPPESRTLRLASLSPGNYAVEFRLGDGSEKRQPAFTIQFTIRKAWWMRWWAITLYCLLLAALLYVLYKRELQAQEKKNRLRTEKIELEKNLNRSILTSIKSQMNPHFFYNALNTIQSYIYSNERQHAGTYLSKFARLTRMILEMSDKDYVSLQEEITALHLYLELEQARFGEDFTFSIEVLADTDAENTRLPSMLIQPYIENAVKHGLLHKKGAKKVSVTFGKTGKNLLVRIEDNGIGRARSAELNQLRKDKPGSFSTEANKKRIELLNEGRKNPLTIAYTDKQDENGQACGTIVSIQIPVQS